MKSTPNRSAPAGPASGPRGRSALTALGLCLALTTVAPLQAQNRASEPVVLNFVGAEIEAVARTMANITGRNVVVDPRVKGLINLSTERPVSPAAALNQFAAVLRLQGFSLVDTGGLYKIVPEADAKLQGNVVNAGPASRLPASNTVVTQIFRLNHESANNLVPVLRPLIGPNNTINVNPGNNSLVITDYADNLQRIGRIISALDISGATDVDIIPLQHALAIDLVPLVSRLIEGGSGGGCGARPGRHLVQDHAGGRAAQQQPDPARGQPGAGRPGALHRDPARPAQLAGRQRQHLRRLPEKCQRGGPGHHAARRAGGRSGWVERRGQPAPAPCARWPVPPAATRRHRRSRPVLLLQPAARSRPTRPPTPSSSPRPSHSTGNCAP